MNFVDGVVVMVLLVSVDAIVDDEVEFIVEIDIVVVVAVDAVIWFATVVVDKMEVIIEVLNGFLVDIVVDEGVGVVLANDIA